MAREAGVSPATVQRLWSSNDIKPHLTRTFKLSSDPDFEAKFWDVIGLYLHPPAKALVLCCDEKSLGGHSYAVIGSHGSRHCTGSSGSESNVADVMFSSRPCVER